MNPIFFDNENRLQKESFLFFLLFYTICADGSLKNGDFHGSIHQAKVYLQKKRACTAETSGTACGRGGCPLCIRPGQWNQLFLF
jgi:hypothetical protein